MSNLRFTLASLTNSFSIAFLFFLAETAFESLRFVFLSFIELTSSCVHFPEEFCVSVLLGFSDSSPDSNFSCFITISFLSLSFFFFFFFILGDSSLSQSALFSILVQLVVGVPLFLFASLSLTLRVLSWLEFPL